MKKTFKDYKLSIEILEALEILHYNSPTLVQEEVIPLLVDGKDVVVKSKTGSGKTAAFGIPICEKIIWDINEPQVLVLEPTRELTVQVKEELYQIGRKKRIKVPDLVGGFPIDKQIQTLKQKSHIVVGTPGRVNDHIRRGTLKLQNIKTIVLDEADLMLDMGFIDDVKAILNQIEQPHQTMLFSATLEENIKVLVSQYLNNPILVDMMKDVIEDKGKIIEKIYEVSGEGKYDLFLKLMMQENPDSCMIFCGTKEMVNVLCRKLRKDGVKCGMIHGDIDQQDRMRTIENFRIGKLRYLIATDVIARGIDFENLSHVFNYDFPTGKETYVHRIGRTGRNGATGIAVSLVTPDDERMRKQVEEYINYTIPVEMLATIDPKQKEAFIRRQTEKVVLKQKKGAGFQKTIMKLSIGGGKKSKMRAGDIVGAICGIPGITGDDIGTIDVRDSLTYVEILNEKGKIVLDTLQKKPVKGKIRKVRITK